MHESKAPDIWNSLDVSDDASLYFDQLTEDDGAEAHAEYYIAIINEIRPAVDAIASSDRTSPRMVTIQTGDTAKPFKVDFKLISRMFVGLQNLVQLAMVTTDGMQDAQRRYDEGEGVETLYGAEIDEVIEGVEQLRTSSQSLRRRQLQNKLNTIFPANVAGVNIPEGVNLKVPAVARWRRTKNGLSNASADAAYMRLAADARANIADEFAQLDPPTVDTNAIREQAAKAADEVTESRGERLTDVLAEIKAVSGGGLISLVKLAESRCRLETEGAIDDKYIGKLCKDILHYTDLIKRLNDAYSELGAGMDEQTRKHIIASVAAQFRPEWIQAVDQMFHEIVKSNLVKFCEALDQYEPSTIEPKERSISKIPKTIGAKAVEKTVSPVDVPVLREVEPPQPTQLHTSDFLWLIEAGEEDRNLAVEQRGVVGFVDGRTSVARDIEARSFDYHTANERDKVIANRINYAVDLVASASNGHLSMNSVNDVRKDVYPNKIIYNQVKGPNADRVYFTIQPVESFGEREQAQLKDAGIEKVVVLIGACRKKCQEEMLTQFTGLTTRQLRRAGAGSI